MQILWKNLGRQHKTTILAKENPKPSGNEQSGMPGNNTEIYLHNQRIVCIFAP